MNLRKHQLLSIQSQYFTKLPKQAKKHCLKILAVKKQVKREKLVSSLICNCYCLQQRKKDFLHLTKKHSYSIQSV